MSLSLCEKDNNYTRIENFSINTHLTVDDSLMLI